MLTEKALTKKGATKMNASAISHHFFSDKQIHMPRITRPVQGKRKERFKI